MSDTRAATNATIACNHAVEMQLPFSNREDFDDARRGFVGTLSPALVRGTGDRLPRATSTAGAPPSGAPSSRHQPHRYVTSIAHSASCE